MTRHILTSVLLQLILPASSLFAQEMPNYNIGVVFPLSGPQAPYGEEAMRGVDLAMAKLSKDDPDFAKRLNVIKVDDKSTAEEAAKATKDLFEKKRAHVIFGSLTGASTLEMAQIAKQEKRPLLTPIATTDGLDEETFVFRSCFSEEDQGAILAAFAGDSLKQKRMAIFRDDSQTAQDIAASFRKAFTRLGGKTDKDIVYPAGSEDLTSYLNAIKALPGTWVVLPTNYHTAAKIMQQAQTLSLSKKFLGTDGWDSPTLLKLGGPASEGHFFTSHFATDTPRPEVEAFTNDFKTRYGREPGTIAALSYDGFLVLADILKRAHTTLKKPLYKAFLATDSYQGVTGRLSFRDNGEAIKSAVIKETTPQGLRFKTEISPR